MLPNVYRHQSSVFLFGENFQSRIPHVAILSPPQSIFFNVVPMFIELEFPSVCLMIHFLAREGISNWINKVGPLRFGCRIYVGSTRPWATRSEEHTSELQSQFH